MVDVDQFSKWPEVYAIPDLGAFKVVAYQTTYSVSVTSLCLAHAFGGIRLKV